MVDPYSISLPSLNNLQSDQNLEEDDYFVLRRAWINELSSPELLPYCHEQVNNLLELIQHQQTIIDGSGVQIQHAFLHLSYELECMRYQYVLRCYLETRIEKIEKLAYYLDLQVVESWRQRILSEYEREFLDKLISTMDQYYLKTVVKSMPAYLIEQKASKITEPDMIVAPNIKEHVTCLVIDDNIGTIELTHGSDTSTQYRMGSLSLQKGDIYRLPYETIRTLLYQDKICLL
jgi:GINS complex subunit 4